MNPSNLHFDCLIIGAGLVGMLSALELANAGHRVVIVDKGEAAQQASWAGGGVLSPLPPWGYSNTVNALAEQSQRLYPVLCNQLEANTGINSQWWRSGMRVLHPVASAREWLLANNYPHHFESESLLLPEVAQLRTPRLGKAVRAALQAHPSIELLEKHPVSELHIKAGRCIGVALENGDALIADTTVIAAGAWSASLLPENYWRPAIEPVRGQMLLFKPEGAADEPLLSEVLLSDKHYLIPRRDGRILVGSTLEHVGFDNSTTARAAEELVAAALLLLPALEGVAVEHHWAGLRPGSPGGIPSIGRHPEIAGLHYNSGHYRNGVVLAPASAQVLAAQLAGDPMPEVLSACLPSEQCAFGAASLA